MPTSLLDNLRSKFTRRITQLLHQQSHTYRNAAGIISKNDQLRQEIFENLIAIVQSDDLTAAKKAATHALHISNELDSNFHFLLSYRTHEQKAREAEIESFTHEFNKTVDLLVTKLQPA